MQSSFGSGSTSFAPSSILQNTHNFRKHKLDELDEEEDIHHDTASQNDNTFGRVHFAANTAREKRRKVEHHNFNLGFEPVFQGLSLSSNGSVREEKQDAVIEEIGEDEEQEPVEEMPTRGRLAKSRQQQRRESTPFPSPSQYASEDACPPSSSHRRRSSSRNRARNTTMNRYDPSRPHVVFVDSLSDDEDENEDDARFHTTSSSPNSSDIDEVIPSSSATRPIRINKRLRDHLRKQNVDFNGPLLENILSDSPARNGGAGIAERGLVLYRPLSSWGIVEEPEEGVPEKEEEEEEEVRIWELEDGDELDDGMQSASQNEMAAGIAGDGDTEMDLD